MYNIIIRELIDEISGWIFTIVFLFRYDCFQFPLLGPGGSAVLQCCNIRFHPLPLFFDFLYFINQSKGFFFDVLKIFKCGGNYVKNFHILYVIPAKAGIQTLVILCYDWIPLFPPSHSATAGQSTGMTVVKTGLHSIFQSMKFFSSI